MTRILGLAGIGVAAALAYSYYQRNKGGQVAAGAVATPNGATIAVDTGTQDAGISSAPAKTPASTGRTSSLQAPVLRFGSVAQSSPNGSIANGVLFSTRKFQALS